ncbi:hypothetical protein J5Y06_03005 [Tianweitania sediminis]|uniref:Uncharacterized protein n=2 Tax=Tianweitania sediminis TaxID=1502156 RepID=A0A8J7R4Y6_9HYPH|nr:hypothetical protein [Tianweitania sediminis]MBP0437622.1 hypothetical protein [Tianweitania sediminis]
MEAERIIARANTQTDGGAMAVMKRTAQRGRDHFAARDADADDWIEVWGTRIGRAIGILLFIGLILYLGGFVLG